MTEPTKSSTSSSVDDRSKHNSHPLVPHGELLAWLESRESVDGKRSRFMFPVVVVVGGLGIDSAFIGSSVEASQDDHLVVRLDDGALGIPLTDRIRTLCPSASRCALWLEGYWGPLLVEDLIPSDAAPTIAVLTVGELLSDDSAAVRVRFAD